MTNNPAAWISAARAVRRSLLQTFVPEWVWPRYVSLHGVNIPVRDQPFSFGVKRALCRNIYELPERTLLTHVLEPGMHVIELGTSLGIVTAVAAERVGPAGRIVGVEASPRLAQIAADWLYSRYANVSIFCGYGFPTTSLPSSMKIGGFQDEGGSLGGHVHFALDEAKDVAADSDQILAYDLERVMQKASMSHPQMLICDIEGSELVMKDKGFTLPDSLQYIVIELHPHLYPHGSSDEQNIIASMQRLGFRQGHMLGASRLFQR